MGENSVGGGRRRDQDAATPAPPDGPRRPEAAGDDLTSKVIPYRNPMALVAYYVAIASIIPCVALLAGPAAVILGTLGLKAATANPGAHGRAHAWVGIVLGGLTLAANILAVALIAASSLSP